MSSGYDKGKITVEDGQQDRVDMEIIENLNSE